MPNVAVVYALTKGGMHCLAGGCNKRIDFLTITHRNDFPWFSRREHRRDHGGLRGATWAHNNILPGFVCPACARQGRM